MKMTNKEKLTEATIKILQENDYDVNYYRERLKNIQAKYKEIPRTSYMFKNNIKDEKEALINLKQALASERGTFVKPIQITNLIKKNLGFDTYSDRASAVRGFHIDGEGNFKINTDNFKSSLNEQDLFYEIEFYGDNNKIKENMERVKQLLVDNGFDVKSGSHTDALYVSCYRK